MISRMLIYAAMLGMVLVLAGCCRSCCRFCDCPRTALTWPPDTLRAVQQNDSIYMVMAKPWPPDSPGTSSSASMILMKPWIPDTPGGPIVWPPDTIIFIAQ